MEDDLALRKVLRDLSISLSEDSELREIEFRHDDELGAIDQNRQITINPRHAEILDAEDKISEEQEFALLVNTESHEIEHDLVTDVEAMEEFAEEYEGKRPRLAAFIWNVIEDVYIDKRRTDRDRGLRPTLALQSDLIRGKQEPVTEMEPPYKHANAVLHIGKAGGTPVGFDEVEDEEYKNFCAEIRALVDEARNTPIQSDRTEIAHQIMDLIEEYAGNLEAPELDMPEFMMAVPEDMIDEDGDPLPDPAENDQMEEMDEEMQEAMEDMMEEMDGDGGSGQSGGSQMQGSQDGDGGGGDTNPPCPECGYEDTEQNARMVDGMVAARSHPPFNMDADWVSDVGFVADNDEEGVCGFRVRTNGSVPKQQIESNGYKVVNTGGNTVEILEPKERYDDREAISEYECPDCGHTWIPGVADL